jgi:elongation factor 1-beta
VGFIVVTYKVFPTDIVANFDKMKENIETSLPKFASVHGYGEEPVAYGLKALLVQIKFPEDKSGLLEEFEKNLESMDDISQLQTFMVRRISR